MNFLYALTDLENTSDMLATPAIENILRLKAGRVSLMYWFHVTTYLCYIGFLFVIGNDWLINPKVLMPFGIIQIIFELI
jgi:hypothetical protein